MLWLRHRFQAVLSYCQCPYIKLQARELFCVPHLPDTEDVEDEGVAGCHLQQGQQEGLAHHSLAS